METSRDALGYGFDKCVTFAVRTFCFKVLMPSFATAIPAKDIRRLIGQSQCGVIPRMGDEWNSRQLRRRKKELLLM